MANLEFDREAVGVSAKADWHDSQTFASVASFARSLSSKGTAVDLPRISSPGTAALRKEIETWIGFLDVVAAEFSDACADLGSGQKEASENYDATEKKSTNDFRKIADTMGGAV